MTTSSEVSVAAPAPQQAGVDLTTCDREPIHIPGSIQPHGYLLALSEPDLTVLQASANVADLIGRDVKTALGRPLDEILGHGTASEIGAGARAMLHERTPLYLRTVRLGDGRAYRAIVHRSGRALVLELEPTATDAEVSFANLYPLIREFVASLANVASIEELSQLAAKEVRRLTGFDKVLVYKFDESWNGVVIGEDKGPEFESFMDLRFPASDIPAQARELYRVNHLRLIADASYTPVPIVPAVNPLSGKPLDLTFSTLRSVSPIHVEYLHNMGIVASMSISIVRQGKLWGLVSCHHKTPRVVPLEVRTACDLLGQVISMQLEAKEHGRDVEHRMRLKGVQGQLLAYMTMEGDFIDGLAGHADELLALTNAAGCAIVHDGRAVLVGQTPGNDAVVRIVNWLAEVVGKDVYATDALPGVLVEARDWAEHACGVLAIAISKLHRSYVVWFRPEVVRTVSWGGDPRKPVEPLPGDVRLHPRKSFEAWKEVVRGRSLAWRPVEVEAAGDLRNSIVGIVLRKAEEMAELSAELERSNKELEAFSYSVSHDLRAPFRHIVGYSELLREHDGAALSDEGKRYIATIIESAQYAGTLVDNLLAFSQMGRSELVRAPVNMDVLFREAVAAAVREHSGRKIEWKTTRLPEVHGDASMLKLVAENLIGNAVKYTRDRDPAVVEIGVQDGPKEVVFYVRDNGVGFDMRYANKLFGVFQRLHKMEEFEGTGIGLANVRRIVARHGGRTWAEGALDRGATFYFSMPKREKAE